MRFISKYGRFGVQIVPLVQEAYATGLVKVIQEPIYASFEPYKLTPLEREMALAHWHFNGSYQEMDEATMVQPDFRIGLFDSSEAQARLGWSDETREFVDSTLEDHAERYDDILVVRSTVPPPWPNYDEFRGTPQALVRRLIEDGHDLDAVLTYERDHQKRPKVLEEIQEAISAGPVTVPAEEEVLG
jgi:hypothetical protein